MRSNKTKGKKTLIIVAAAVLVAGIGFGAGMMAKSAMAAEQVISENEAKNIALADVGVSEKKATFTKVKLDNDGHYDIEFYTNSIEYDFEVDATTGRIIEKEAEARKLPNAGIPNNEAQDTSTQNQQVQPGQSSGNSDASVIGVDAAKKTAMHHAGISSANFTKAHLDYDDGVRIYELEFCAGGIEYDYEIDAYSGAIIDWDKDYCDNERHGHQHQHGHDDWDDDWDD